MVNVLELPSEDVAIALGHIDGGELVRKPGIATMTALSTVSQLRMRERAATEKRFVSG